MPLFVTKNHFGKLITIKKKSSMSRGTSYHLSYVSPRPGTRGGSHYLNITSMKKWKNEVNEWRKEKNVLPSVNLPIGMLPLTNCLAVAISLYGFFMIRTHSRQHMWLVSVALATTAPGVLWATRAGKHSFSIKGYLWTQVTKAMARKGFGFWSWRA